MERKANVSFLKYCYGFKFRIYWLSFSIQVFSTTQFLRSIITIVAFINGQYLPSIQVHGLLIAHNLIA